MKLKINKACDLNSISVLPPQARKTNTGASNSQLRSQQSNSQLRSQQSQQSFSQSQHGMFSQFSQSSFDDPAPSDQRFASQERDNPGRRVSCLAPYSREESQMPPSRSSTNMIRKWNPPSVSDGKCQVSEELEHRIGMMENSMNRTGLVLDSVQSDVMQVNKGTKEVSMEMEGLRQKLNVYDNSLHLMNKGQESIKASLNEGLKAISADLNKDIYDEMLQKILSTLSALPGQIEACLLKLQNDLSKTYSKDLQAIACHLKNLHQLYSAPTDLPSKGASTHVILLEEQKNLNNRAVPPMTRGQAAKVPKIEMGNWNSVKVEHGTFTDRGSKKAHRQKGYSLYEQEREFRVIIDSDEEIDDGFSCLLKGKETGTEKRMFNEAKEETDQILRKARRRKRKCFKPIIIN